LHRFGFVAGISEQLSANQNRYGLTSVEQFSSAKGAHSELAAETDGDGPWQMFSVPGIPAAVGFGQGGGGQGGRNIAFSHGDYVYLIGSGWQNGNKNGVPQASLIAVAQQLYKRVSG
jgi:hypothetical protein